MEKDLEGFREGWESERSAERREHKDLTQVGLQAEAKLLELVVIYTYQNNKDETDHKTIRDRKQ